MRWEVLLLLRSKYVCVYFWMTVEVSIWIVCLMFMCVYYWQMRHILCTGTRCKTVFIPIPVHCYIVSAKLCTVLSLYGQMDGWIDDMFVDRRDRRWWLAHLWKEDRKCVMEKKTSACGHLNSRRFQQHQNQSWDQYTDGPILQDSTQDSKEELASRPVIGPDQCCKPIKFVWAQQSWPFNISSPGKRALRKTKRIGKAFCLGWMFRFDYRGYQASNFVRGW